MVAAVVISSTALQVDLTCRRLDIMLLEVEMALEVKVTCRDSEVDNQDGCDTRPTRVQVVTRYG